MGKVTVEIGSVPATPNSGDSVIYPKVDGYWYSKNAAGDELILSGIAAVGTIDTVTASANGIVLQNQNIYMQSASATRPGLVNNSTQTFSGIKTFQNQINANGGIDLSASGTLTIGATNSTIINIGNSGATVNIIGSINNESVTNLNVTDSLITLNKGGGAGSASLSGIELEENSTITGYAKSSSDRNSWALKAPNTAGIVTLTPGAGGITLNQSSHDPLTLGTTNGLSLSSQVLSLQASDTSHTGALTSTDWNTFNNKQPAGNYITALTGDLTASGPGSVSSVLATVNSNVGSFGSSTAIPSFTVNGKGLITAASTNVVVAPAGTLTGTTLASNVVTSSLTTVGTIGTGAWQGTTVATGFGGTGVTSVTTAPTATSFAGWDANQNLSADSFIPGYATTATAAGTTTLTVNSVEQQYFTGSTTQTVALPVVSTMVTGQRFKIVNLSSGIVTVQSSGANTIQAMAANTQLQLTVISTSGTGTASWDWVYTSVESVLPASSTLSNTHIFVGNASNVATDVAVSGDATLGNTGALTLATVNSNVGTFGSATKASVITVNGKGLITAASESTVTPAVGSITGLATGIATFLATPSSANLASALTDETGSGAAVFATSPTLVTPLLGTPTSGTLTNCTGLPMTTGVTGTLPAGNGGTGVTSVTIAPTASAFAGWDANSNLSANNTIDGYATTATAAGTTTLTVASAKLQFFSGSTTQTVKMPVVTTLVNGQSFVVTNLSSGVVTVQSSGTNTIKAMAANSTLLLVVRDATAGTGTTSWSWVYTPVLDATLPIVNGGTGVTAVTTTPTASAFAGWDSSSNLSANSFVSTSDERFKSDIETSPGIASVLKLRGVNFKWIKNDHLDAGVIAQEVETVFPNAVITDQDGFKNVKYNYLMAPMIEAIKDLHTEIESLKAIIKDQLC